MENLIIKYGVELVTFTIDFDELTPSEYADLDYLEDRIKTHLEFQESY